MCRLHDNEKKVIEPAGALSTTAVHFLEEAGYPIKGKNVICMMTGGNIDMGRWSDIRLRSLEHL
jgi:threonine dehydratase